MQAWASSMVDLVKWWWCLIGFILVIWSEMVSKCWIDVLVLSSQTPRSESMINLIGPCLPYNQTKWWLQEWIVRLTIVTNSNKIGSFCESINIDNVNTLNASKAGKWISLPIYTDLELNDNLNIQNHELWQLKQKQLTKQLKRNKWYK